MTNKAVQFIFFANYFVGLLAVMLAVETCVQLQLPFSSPAFYIFLFFATVLYYTWAYILPPAGIAVNPRTAWYKAHTGYIVRTQILFIVIIAIALSVLIIENFNQLHFLSIYDWIILSSIPLTGILYYGLLPRSILNSNLRNTGWIKPFVIGYVWAGWIFFLPVMMAKMEENIQPNATFMLWLFIKNWMFCTVNAIMFDIKDYADDSNKQLKTFVVRFGLRKTIFVILIPLLAVGVISFLIFAVQNHFSLSRIIFNLIPFACLLYVSLSLQQRKSILYYLIVIDGLLLIKAVCGICGIIFQ
ncbi:MAG: UbiA family prenyltransferase [Agriterribacter sp.]